MVVCACALDTIAKETNAGIMPDQLDTLISLRQFHAQIIAKDMCLPVVSLASLLRLTYGALSHLAGSLPWWRGAVYHM